MWGRSWPGLRLGFVYGVKDVLRGILGVGLALRDLRADRDCEMSCKTCPVG